MGEDVLDVARFQAGKLRLARQPMELRPLVQEAGESFRDVAASQGLALEVHAAPGLQVHADPRRLAQVVDNLLGNAIKFTPPGGRVTLEARSVPGGCVVEVCDTGLGIRPEDLGKLFQPFSQVHDAVDRARPGSGLGLHVCRGVVEAHGGRIWASSEGPGRGARFTFSLPAAASEAPQAPG
jgi:signal transduction histidine kinase